MDKKFIVANLKKTMLLSKTIDYLKIVNDKINDDMVIICPSSIYIPYFLKHNYAVGIQNIHYDDINPCTGEITGKEVSDIGVKYVIIGHSDRKTNFFETDEVINRKVHNALKNKLSILLCVGETYEEKTLLKTERVLKRQVLNYLNGLKSSDLENIMIVYEPVWSISNNGKGFIPSNKDIDSVCIYIKSLIDKQFNCKNIKILYGGNVNTENITELKCLNEISGFMLGDAGSNANKLLNIIEVVRK